MSSDGKVTKASAGWVYDPPRSHVCIKPTLNGAVVGAIWRCGDCGAFFEVHSELGEPNRAASVATLALRRIAPVSVAEIVQEWPAEWGPHPGFAE